jgi:hypothetical protein
MLMLMSILQSKTSGGHGFAAIAVMTCVTEKSRSINVLHDEGLRTVLKSTDAINETVPI